MRLLDDLSYRVKVPISLTLAILISGLVIAAVLIARGGQDLRNELYDNAQDVGGLLVNTLIPVMRHDDLWQAYQVLNGAGGESHVAGERLLLVIGNDRQVYVSNRPQRFPVGAEVSSVSAEIARLVNQLDDDASVARRLYERQQDKSLYVVLPLVDDGVRIGWLIMGYPKTLLSPKLVGLYWRVTFSAFAVIALLIPVGWFIGKQMVRPLLHLTDSMALVGQQPPEEINYRHPERRDEIGRLGNQFEQMLGELAEKSRFERQMVASERLAAIGRVAAGVAHEINNPLGGMMNALSTFKRYGRNDPLTEKTASLLERGLKQIQDTVSVLLVQAKAESHPFTPRDVDDVSALLAPQARRAGVALILAADGDADSSLPSTPLRQILMNLGLNAIRACAEGGGVTGQVRFTPDGLLLQMENPGETIPADRLGHLFEPFVSGSSGGQGLGLWVTYQIVQQLKGEIAVVSEEGVTQFIVHLPQLAQEESR